MSSSATSRRPAALLGRLAALCALVGVDALVPSLRVAILLATFWTAAAVAGVLVVRRRPPSTSPWWPVTATMILVASGQTALVASGGLTPLPQALFVATEVLCIGGLTSYLRRRRMAISRPFTQFQWADTAVITVGAALTTTYLGRWIVTGAHGTWLDAAGAVLCLVILGQVMWVFGTKAPIPVVSSLQICAIALNAVQELLLVAVPASDGAAVAFSAIGTAGAGLLLLSALDPGMITMGAPTERGGDARPSTRLLALLAFAAAPWAVTVIGSSVSHPLVPPILASAVGGIVVVLILLRTFGYLRASEALAEIDTLTGLLNRRGLMRLFDVARHLDVPLWVALVDTDNFKGINDGYGHHAGDVVLRSVAVRLVEAAGDEGTVARAGGDEFVVLWRGEDPALLIERLQACAVGTVTVRGVELSVGCSIGLARADGRGVDDALADADAAMYAAKQRGGARVLRFEAALRSQALGRSALVSDVRMVVQAPGGTAGRLVVLYQPVVSLTGEPIGVESLVRWTHPDRGLINPDDFLPLVEDLGLGAELDRQVLEQALHQISTWDAAGIDRVHRVAVNLGAGSLRSPTLAHDVAAACARTGVSPTRLILEITEHEEAPDDARTLGALQTLAASGVTIALDDFGSGYAGVGYLLRYPITLVKLDRSLLPPGDGDVCNSARGGLPARLLLEGVMAMAGITGLEVTVEGLETQEHLALARELGMHHAQGWLFAKAMEPGAVAEFWRSRSSAETVASSAETVESASWSVQAHDSQGA